MAITVNGAVAGGASTPRIGQVVTSTTSSVTTTSGSGWFDVSGLSVTITPTSASSQILIVTSFGTQGVSASSPYALLYVQLVRDTTPLTTFTTGMYYPNGGNVNTASGGHVAITRVDSPNTTSAVTYKVQINNIFSINSVQANPSGASIQISAMEVLV